MKPNKEKTEADLAAQYGSQSIKVFWEVVHRHAHLDDDKRLEADTFYRLLHRGLLRAQRRRYIRDETAEIWADYISLRDGSPRRTVRESLLTSAGSSLADDVLHRLADDGWPIDRETREIVDRVVSREVREGLTAHSFEFCLVETIVILDTQQGVIPRWLV